MEIQDASNYHTIDQFRFPLAKGKMFSFYDHRLAFKIFPMVSRSFHLRRCHQKTVEINQKATEYQIINNVPTKCFLPIRIHQFHLCLLPALYFFPLLLLNVSTSMIKANKLELKLERRASNLLATFAARKENVA